MGILLTGILLICIFYFFPVLLTLFIEGCQLLWLGKGFIWWVIKAIFWMFVALIIGIILWQVLGIEQIVNPPRTYMVNPVTGISELTDTVVTTTKNSIIYDVHYCQTKYGINADRATNALEGTESCFCKNGYEWNLTNTQCIKTITSFIIQEQKDAALSTGHIYIPGQGYYVSGPHRGEPTGYCDVCGRPDPE
jgi:hypothetical protein